MERAPIMPSEGKARRSQTYQEQKHNGASPIATILNSTRAQEQARAENMKGRLSLMVGTALMCLCPTLLAQTILRTDTIQEIVITGTGTQHLLKNAPVQTEVITHKMLQQYGVSEVHRRSFLKNLEEHFH